MIQQTNKRILDALNCALRGDSVSWAGLLDEPARDELYSRSVVHSVLPLVADALPRELLWGGKSGIFVKFAKRSQQEILWQAGKTGELCLLYRYLRKKGLHPLIMKGIVCRSLYPEPEHRPSVDEDLLVKPAEFQRLHEAMLEYGLKLSREELDPAEQFEVSYVDKSRGIYIEVHKTPFSPDSPYLDRLNDCFLGVHDRAVSQRIYGTDYLTLGLEDHLLYLLLHALKHFLYCGFGIRQICDIGLYAEAHRDEIDWQSLHALLAKQGVLDFARAVFRIADESLLTDSHMKAYLADWHLDGIDPEPLLEDVMEGGVYGSATMSRLHSSNITLQAASNQSTHGLRGVFYSLFPPLEAMQGKFPYLKKLPVLLPLAWLQRQVGYLWELIRHRGRSNSALKSIQVGSERIQLLKKYHIIQ